MIGLNDKKDKQINKINVQLTAGDFDSGLSIQFYWTWPCCAWHVSTGHGFSICHAALNRHHSNGSANPINQENLTAQDTDEGDYMQWRVSAHTG